MSKPGSFSSKSCKKCKKLSKFAILERGKYRFCQKSALFGVLWPKNAIKMQKMDQRAGFSCSNLSKNDDFYPPSQNLERGIFRKITIFLKIYTISCNTINTTLAKFFKFSSFKIQRNARRNSKDVSVRTFFTLAQARVILSSFLRSVKTAYEWQDIICAVASEALKKKILNYTRKENTPQNQKTNSNEQQINIQQLSYFAKIRGKIAVQGTKIEEKTKITYASYIDVTGRHVMHVPALV